MRGYDIKVLINGTEVARQDNAEVTRTTKLNDVSNKITMEWTESVAGLRSWNVSASGCKVAGAAAFNLLETAFDNGEPVTIDIGEYTGKALITSFPFGAKYDNAVTYNFIFSGTGKLEKK